ncbi:MAG TPA: flavin reductase family protein [Candidatus Merdivicinus intestinigallinarum]|nr:flavin reductase family protein [Candidatus Merdivicinus intestinigallinarum]
MFHEVNPLELSCNPFQMIGKDWALVTAGDETGYNTMTVSWGNMGIMWNKNIVTVFIRPQRYTKEFLDRFDNFTLSFYEESSREALKLCGSKSGRDLDKIKAAGLTPVHENGTTYFEEARLVLECKKIYLDKIRPEGFLDPSIQKNYPENDYHLIYMGEITRVLQK